MCVCPCVRVCVVPLCSSSLSILSHSPHNVTRYSHAPLIRFCLFVCGATLLVKLLIAVPCSVPLLTYSLPLSPQVVFADWKGRSTSKGEKKHQWVKHVMPSHYGTCTALERSPFLEDIVLSVGDWTFHVWEVRLGARVCH